MPARRPPPLEPRAAGQRSAGGGPRGLQIREATPADVPALARLGAKLARAHHAMDRRRFFLPGEPLEDGYAWWLGKERRNPRAVVLAALRRGRVIGYAYGRVEPRDWNTLRDRCGVGIDLWVEPRARGGGVGAALVDALAAALAGRGAPRLVIDVAARNPRARAVFARLGFRETMLELTRELPAAAPRRRGARTARPATR